MVRDRELAEDLAQDTFVKILNHIDRYRPEFKLSSWLFKIANNVAIDYLRKRQVPTISMDGSPHASTRRCRIQQVPRSPTSRNPRWPRWSREHWERHLKRPISGLARIPRLYHAPHVEGQLGRRKSPPRSDLPLGTVRAYIHRGGTKATAGAGTETNVKRAGLEWAAGSGFLARPGPGRCPGPRQAAAPSKQP